MNFVKGSLIIKVVGVIGEVLIPPAFHFSAIVLLKPR